MTKNKRKRPGKSQRANTVAKAIRAVAIAKVTANQALLDAEKAKPKDFASKLAATEGPAKPRNMGRLSGSCDRARLKLGSYGVGFQGPRGFNSPKDRVSKAEQTPGLLAPGNATRPAYGVNGSRRFAEDDYATDKPERGIKRRKGKGRFKLDTLNESQPAPHDDATDRIRDSEQRKARLKALKLNG